MSYSPHNRRILRLTPLEAAAGCLAALTPLSPPHPRPLARAVGLVLAADVRAPADQPQRATAMIDGWAVAAEDLVASSAYSAAILSPAPGWVDAGDPLPDGTDAVLPPEAVTLVAPGTAEAVATIAPGDGVRAAGQDAAAGTLLLPAGTRLDARHIGTLSALGLETVTVRVPRVRLVLASDAAIARFNMVRTWVEAAGAEVVDTPLVRGNKTGLATTYSASGADLVLSLGSVGQGRNDHAVAALAQAGEVECHGIAVRPGGAAAFGRVGETPVLLLPDPVGGILAGLLTLVGRVLATAAGRADTMPATSFRLAEKVNSTIGLSEIFLSLPQGDAILPVALEEAGFDALSLALGWFIVPPESEGLAAGESVHVRPFHPR